MFYILNGVLITVFYVNYSFLVPKLLLNKKIGLYLITFVVFFLFFMYVLEPLILISKDFQPPNETFEDRILNRKENGPRFEFRPPIMVILFFGLSTSIKLVSEWYKAEKERALVASQKVNSELSFLKAQLNPHFLFNTLNSIYSLANKKSEDTTIAIVTLSELMRYMIYETNQEYISLTKEVEYIKNYISLHLLRLKDSSGVRVNVHGDLNYKIEPLLLISFIENAFKYGTNYKGDTNIRIKINVENDELHLYVFNACYITKVSDKNSGIGLENIKNRLNLLYPKQHTLEINNEKKSFEVNLTIKLKK
ncbi:histidine kinase [Polaribacter vadi]|uniref:sensor histidine kinase n=1 Tax=Polaribacter TaxID=52959 RepID=UPI001C081770|nr:MULTISPECIES: histidine kinase [Polaribacter]MBU3012631.1 histidine kinase [Polaribacter vadi]MDO6742449.1 histidine kinase [Polaribacter sp. 1_MG-2023]